MVFHPCIKQELGETMGKQEGKNRKKQAHADGIDLVDWFLAIEACLL
jgi:hypothetical protein